VLDARGRLATVPFLLVDPEARTVRSVRLLLVRHGRAAASWDADADPGLDALGRAQAGSVAVGLAESAAGCRVVSSPLRRARETAEPLARRWAVPVAVDAAFGEVPSPTADLASRGPWLRSALAGTWDELDDGVARWRGSLVDAALGLAADTVAFTHFVAINALVGWATGSPKVTTFLPANASVTELEVVRSDAGCQLHVVRLGQEATPEVG
jgi:probable phosphoglycerate mutase